MQSLTLTGFDIGRAFAPTLFSMVMCSKEKAEAPVLSSKMAVKILNVSTGNDDLCLL